MKKLFFVPFLLLLLTSCQSKREICADRAGDRITVEKAANKLGISEETNSWDTMKKIKKFCEFYKN